MAREVDFTGHRVRPPHVLQAILRGDSEKCSEFGRRGAASRQRLRVTQKAHKNREAHAAAKRAAAEDAALAAFRQQLIKEDDARYFEQMHRECNYDVCPID